MLPNPRRNTTVAQTVTSLTLAEAVAIGLNVAGIAMVGVAFTLAILFTSFGFLPGEIEPESMGFTGIWTSASELAGIPASGPGWEAVSAAAEQNFYPPVIENNNSNTDVNTLAAAIVYARSGVPGYRDRVIQALDYLVATGIPDNDPNPDNWRTLQWARNTGAYVLAADLVGYRTEGFQTWARNMAEVWLASDSRTLLTMFKQRPNNWGAMAFGTLTAIYTYLGDATRLNEIRDYWIQSMNGPTPPEAQYGAPIWQWDENNPRWINPQGSTKACPGSPGDPLWVGNGLIAVDGIIPDDLRRNNEPCTANPGVIVYPWEHLQGAVMAARILERTGLSIWEIGDRAILRAAYALQVRLGGTNGAWKADGDDLWQLPFLDRAYGTSWSGSQNVWGHGKNVGWPYVLQGFTTPPPPDTTPPTVSISSPMSGETVSSTIAITATATDNIGIDRVQFFVDSAIVGEDYSDPYSVLWNTANVANGNHTITATARDIAQNTATSAPVTVTVDNVPDTTPPVITDVQATNVTATTATITWTTDEPSNSQVEYGTSPSYGLQTPLNHNPLLRHTVALSGLSAATTYYFQVLSRDGATNLATSGPNTFTTGAPDTTPPTITNARATDASETTATIEWTTDEPATSQVEYGVSSSYGSATPVSPTFTTSHEVTLQNLDRATTYHFRVRSSDASQNAATSGDLTFRTSCSEIWQCGAWGTCARGVETRTCTDDHQCGTIVNRPALTRQCTAGPCTEEWSCTPWSACADGQQSRTCTDARDCGTTVDQPALTQTCTPGGCSEDWVCLAWSSCVNGRQTRICTDRNSCGTEENKPEAARDCSAGGGPSQRPLPTAILTGPAAPGAPHVRLFSTDGKVQAQFFAYAKTFRGGVNVAAGDVDGDGTKEIITGAGPKGSPHIRVFSRDGRLHSQFFGFPKTWRTGGSVVAADLNGDGKDEIAVAPNSGAAHIRVFSFDRATRQYGLLTQRFAYATSFRGGVNLAAGDLNSDGRDEIITAPYRGGGPHIRTFTLNPATGKLDLLSQFFAFPRDFTTGVSVATGDFNTDGSREIIVGAGPGKDPVVRIFAASGKQLLGYLAAPKTYRGGVWVSSVEADRDGRSEVMTTAWSNGRPAIFLVDIDLTAKQAKPLRTFNVYAPSFLGGVRVTGY